MAKQTPARWTYEDFARLPEGDGNRYEIIAGELYVSPAPGLRHQKTVTKLTVALDSHVTQFDLGDVLVGPIEQRQALGLGVGEMAKQHFGIGGFEVERRVFAFRLQEYLAVLHLAVEVQIEHVVDALDVHR